MIGPMDVLRERESQVQFLLMKNNNKSSGTCCSSRFWITKWRHVFQENMIIYSLNHRKKKARMTAGRRASPFLMWNWRNTAARKTFLQKSERNWNSRSTSITNKKYRITDSYLDHDQELIFQIQMALCLRFIMKECWYNFRWGHAAYWEIIIICCWILTIIYLYNKRVTYTYTWYNIQKYNKQYITKYSLRYWEQKIHELNWKILTDRTLFN